MSECIVNGCDKGATAQVGSKDEYSFCPRHRAAWRWFRLGYYEGQGFKVDGLIRKKVWNAAMKEFLRYCEVEIVAWAQIAGSIVGESSERGSR